jgi:universal stress protein A
MKFKPAEKSGGVVVKLGPNETALPRPANDDLTAPLPAFSLKHILVPVDFTDCTKEALMYAVAFAKQFNAAITLLHVVEPAYAPPAEMGGAEIVESKAEAREHLEGLRQQHFPGLRADVLVTRGNAEREIVAAARELECNLILLATHGRTGLSRVLLGSTAEHVVRHAGCPVLIVRPDEREFIASGVMTAPASADATSDRGPAVEAQMIAGA